MYKSNRANKVITDRIESLPEVIELIISGLQVGMSISETLANLSKIGPNCIKESFMEFEDNLVYFKWEKEEESKNADSTELQKLKKKIESKSEPST